MSNTSKPKDDLSSSSSHSPSETTYIPIKINNHEDGKDSFIGRKNQLARFEEDLASYNRGAFLVTGYRGVGKTRFVSEALSNMKRKSIKSFIDEDIVQVNMSLGNGSICVLDLLVDMVLHLADKKLGMILGSTYRATRSVTEFTRKIRESSMTIPDNLLGYVQKTQDEKGQTVTSHKNEDSVRQVETKLIEYINLVSKQQWRNPFKYFSIFKRHTRALWKAPVRRKRKLIFVFDELDKVSAFYGVGNTDDGGNDSKDIVNKLLGSMKRLFSESDALFIFIAGRDILDTYHSEVGHTNALYEHLFKEIYYIPSLLSDRSAGQNSRLSRMIEEYVYYRITGESFIAKAFEDSKEYQQSKSPLYKMEDKMECFGVDKKDKSRCRQNGILLLRNFSNFLTFHTWGNFNKLIRLFSTFLVVKTEDEIFSEMDDRHVVLLNPDVGKSPKDKVRYYLRFDLKAMHRIMLASNLYTLFYQGVGRQLISSDDKLTISSFLLYHHILKYHRIGFSRKHVERASEAISRTRVPRLASVGDSIVNVVLKPFIRETQGGFFLYRFYHHFQQEIIYVSNLAEIDMATYNFSNEAHSEVNNYFKELHRKYRRELKHSEVESGLVTEAKLQEIMGDISVWNERSEDAFIYYGGANSSLSESKKKNVELANFSFANLQYEIQVLVKQGYLEEVRGDYPSAENFYLQLESLVTNFLKDDAGKKITSDIEKNRNLFQTLKNSFLARIFLNVKRTSKSGVSIRDLPFSDVNKLYNNSPFLDYMLGVANFYSLELDSSLLRMVTVLIKEEQSKSYESSMAKIRVCQILVMKSLENVNFESDSIESFLQYFKVKQADVYKFESKYGVSPSPKDIEVIDFEYYFEKLKIKTSDFLDEKNNIKKGKDKKFQKELEHFAKKISGLSVLSLLDLIRSEVNHLWKRGFYNQAANAIFTHLTIAKLFSKSIPLKMISKLENEEKKRIVYITEQIERKISLTFDLMGKLNERLYQKAYSIFKSSFWSEYYESKHRDTDLNSVKIFNCKSVDELRKRYHMDWLYSPLGECFMVMRYWIERVNQNIYIECGVENDEPNNTVQKYALPQSSWVYAMSLYGSGRNIVKKVIAKNDCEIDNEFKEALCYLVESFSYLRNISDNNRLMTFPSLGFISYCIWELLYHGVKITIANKLTEGLADNGLPSSLDKGELYFNAVADVEKKLKPNQVGGFSTRFINLDFVYTTTRQYFEDIVNFCENKNFAIRDILKTKYFINDDFEDPMFSNFWTYIYSFKAGASMHNEVMKDAMNKIRVDEDEIKDQ